MTATGSVADAATCAQLALRQYSFEQSHAMGRFAAFVLVRDG
jgi:hypothetical protein